MPYWMVGLDDLKTSVHKYKYNKRAFFFFKKQFEIVRLVIYQTVGFTPMMTIGTQMPLFLGRSVSQLILACRIFIFVLDQAPPVLTYCPNDIVMDNVTTVDIRVNWQEPTATDNSGVPPLVSLTTNRQSGDLFAVPGSYEVRYKAVDGAGLEATCSFQITLTRT